MMKILLIIGLVMIGTAAALLLAGKIESGVAAIVGIIGIGILSSSGMMWNLAQIRREKAIGAEMRLDRGETRRVGDSDYLGKNLL